MAYEKICFRTSTSASGMERQQSVTTSTQSGEPDWKIPRLAEALKEMYPGLVTRTEPMSANSWQMQRCPGKMADYEFESNFD